MRAASVVEFRVAFRRVSMTDVVRARPRPRLSLLLWLAAALLPAADRRHGGAAPPRQDRRPRSIKRRLMQAAGARRHRRDRQSADRRLSTAAGRPRGDHRQRLRGDQLHRARPKGGACSPSRTSRSQGPDDQTVVVYRGTDRETYSCTPDCSRRHYARRLPGLFRQDDGRDRLAQRQAAGRRRHRQAGR